MTADLTIVGECQGCGCTDLRACLDPATGHGCSWVDVQHSCCSRCAALLLGQMIVEEADRQREEVIAP